MNDNTLTDIKQKFSTLFPLLSQDDVCQIINNAIDTGNTVSKAKETKIICIRCKKLQLFRKFQNLHLDLIYVCFC